ncbi:MAG: SIR2 family protein, partial [Methanobacteriaceae archaeon]|nr:SIR2 family protein [Methanobacteriaceae archaeon]
MTYKIPEEPPEEIIRAYNDGYLAIFIGAGLSENFGIPLWGGLVNNLLNTCLKNVDGFTKKDYNYYKSQDYKKAISYVKSILGDSFFEQIKTKLGKIKNWDDENNIYKKLFEFMVDKDINGNINDCSGIFLTTNADLCLDNFFNEKEIINSPDKLDENFHIHLEDADNNIKLVHLHGSIKDKDSLVFTDEDYLNQYKKTDYIKLLDIIFNKYTILFMGYSLSEWEILKFLIDNLDWKHQKKHFVLLGYPEDNTEKIIEINKIKNDHENNGLKIIPYDYTYTE